MSVFCLVLVDGHGSGCESAAQIVERTAPTIRNLEEMRASCLRFKEMATALLFCKQARFFRGLIPSDGRVDERIREEGALRSVRREWRR